VHRYGAHIFHTSDKEVWEYVQQFAEFNNYINSPVARYGEELYNLPFNMNTFSRMWNIQTPAEAKAIIDRQVAEAKVDEPKNLEEQALSLAGRDVYEKLVKGYTEKQWGRDCTELPAFIIRRLPMRFTFDNNYFNDPYQGIPIGGYTKWIENMLDGIEVRLGTDFLKERDSLGNIASKIIYTGMIDEYYNYTLGKLEYRSLRFETEYLPDTDDFQGNAVVNYTDAETPFTRILEHKHFEFGKGKGTVITHEYPADWKPGDEPYYPLNNDRNNELYKKYEELSEADGNVIFGGRLGKYKYYDMDDTIAACMQDYKRITTT
jgi:UDP-galactopyranose mutase